jgi:PAS domain S-box-containing protein
VNEQRSRGHDSGRLARIGNALAILPLRVMIPLLLMLFGVALGVHNLHDAMTNDASRVERQASQALTADLLKLQASIEGLLRWGKEELAWGELGSLAAHPEFDVALLLDERGQVIAASRHELRGMAPRSAPLDFELPSDEAMARARERRASEVHVTDGGTRVVGFTPVVLGARPGEIRPGRVGMLIVAEDLTSLKAEAWSGDERSVLASILFTAALAAALALLFHAMLTSRVSRLVSVVERFSTRDTGVRSGLSGRDELARVAHAVDSMLDEIVVARRRLEESEGKVRLLLDSTAEAICGTDVGGRCTFCNAAAVRLMHAEVGDELLGRPILGITNDGGKSVTHAVDASAAAEERTVRRTDGTEFPAATWARPLLTNGTVIGQVVTFMDITERRRAEEERAHLLANAGWARARAQVAVRARDEFLSIASHELRTPLTTLLLQVDSFERLLCRGDDTGPSRVTERVAILRRQARRLAALIEEMLDVSRISLTGLSLRLEETDLAAVVHDVVERQRPLASSAGCELCVSLECDACTGYWDRLRLEQLVGNLLSNAIKYGAGRPVELIVTGDAEQVTLVVADQGIGIDEHAQERIFERFERAVSATNYGGFGLGLWLVREVARALEGSVRVDSRPGAGARFTVDLPRRPRKLPVETSAQEVSEQAVSSLPGDCAKLRPAASVTG